MRGCLPGPPPDRAGWSSRDSCGWLLKPPLDQAEHAAEQRNVLAETIGGIPEILMERHPAVAIEAWR